MDSGSTELRTTLEGNCHLPPESPILGFLSLGISEPQVNNWERSVTGSRAMWAEWAGGLDSHSKSLLCDSARLSEQMMESLGAVSCGVGCDHGTLRLFGGSE